MVSLSHIPPEGLQEVLNFMDYLRFKFQKASTTSTPYLPVKLGGLWKDEKIDEKDIDEIRQEMWKSLGNKEL
jgi:hypothetical protein